jgi:predicted homoserine dehydrogenase-like protein
MQEYIMNLQTIFSKFGATSLQPAGVGLVGAGEFGASFMAQVGRMPSLKMVAICDQNIQRAVQAAIGVGFAISEIQVCDDLSQALKANLLGHLVVVDRAELLVQMPLVVVLEATGDPEGAAVTALACIEAGRHVVMATKEAEVVVGAELARRAQEKGVVISPVDGDQPSLLIGLIGWAKIMGFPIVCAGKSSESDFVWDAASNSITAWGDQVQCPDFQEHFNLQASHDLEKNLAGRAKVPFALTTVPDLCEMGIVCNHTGLMPDTPTLNAPLAKTIELPTIFRPKADGGLLNGVNRVDMFNCLRRPDELSFAGGVFVVIEAPDRKTGQLFASKGIPTCPDNKYVLIHNPVHLLGAEATLSVLSAVSLQCSTGSSQVRPLVDLVAIAQTDLEVGQMLEMGERHVINGLTHALHPAKILSQSNPIPYYLCAGLKLRRRVLKGQLLLCDDVDLEMQRPLYLLRKSQDQHFMNAA